MVIDRKKLYGNAIDEGTAQAVLSLSEEDKADAIREAAAETKGEIMEKKYRSLIDNLMEGNARHIKGETLKVKIEEARAKALINAGYIEEILPEGSQPTEKAIEAETKKVITGDHTDKKDATGLGAKLLGNKKKK